jgi:hypothetical protein
VGLQPDLPFDALRPVGSVSAPVVWTPLAGGGPPAWTVNPAAFSASMTLVGRVVRLGDAVDESGAIVAAFLGDELRGAAPLQDAGAAGRLAFLTVHGEPHETGALTFRAYLPSADRTFAVEASVPFAAAQAAGSVATPVALPLRAGATLGGPQGWHMLAPPGADATVGAVLAPIWTQGFPGAGDAGGQANVYRYRESDGAYLTPAAAAEAWPRGEGRFVYVYADDDPRTPILDGGFPKTLPPVGLGPSSPFAFGLAYTPGATAVDGAGWNLLGNPFDAPLDWDVAWTRTGVSNSVYTWDPGYLGGGYRVWNGVAGSLTDGILGRGLAFWVQALEPGATLQAPGTALAGRPESGDARTAGAVPVLALRLESSDRPGLATEAWVTFQDGAADGLDPFDAWALAPLVPNYVALGSAALGDAGLLAVDARGPGPSGVVAIPLAVGAVAGGAATADRLVLTWPGLGVPDDWRLTLVDTHSGERVDLRTAGEIRFATEPGETLAPAAPWSAEGGGPARVRAGSAARFRLEIAPPAATDAEPGAADAWSVEPPQPNPTRGPVALAFTLRAAADVQVSLYDALGRRVRHVAAGPHLPGRHTVRVDGAGLPTGTYGVRIDAGGASAWQRVTLLR